MPYSSDHSCGFLCWRSASCFFFSEAELTLDESGADGEELPQGVVRKAVACGGCRYAAEIQHRHMPRRRQRAEDVEVIRDDADILRTRREQLQAVLDIRQRTGRLVLKEHPLRVYAVVYEVSADALGLADTLVRALPAGCDADCIGV